MIITTMIKQFCMYSTIALLSSHDIPCNAHIPAVMVRFSMPSYTVSETAATISVAVQISSASEAVRVNISTVDATALGKSLLPIMPNNVIFLLLLSAGMDYMPVQVQLVFLPGDFEKMIGISLVNDNLIEGEELFSVSLHSPVSDLKVELPNPTSNVFIIDNDRGGLCKSPCVSNQNQKLFGC